MNLSKLLQFELKYHTKQRAFILFLILFILFGVLAIVSEFQFLEASTMYNDAYNLSLLAGLISLGVLFPCIFMSINGVLRDQTHKFEQILFSSGLTKSSYFISRFLAILIIGLILSSFSFFGVFIGTYLNGNNPETIHVFDFQHYLWPWVIIILPNVFIVSALLFSMVILSRKSVTTYITGVLILGFYWFSAFTINSPLIGGSSLSSPEIISKVALLDIFGLSPFFEQTQFLTPIEKNEYLISLSGYFFQNRLLWIVIGCVVLFLSYKQFSFRILNSRAKKSVSNKEDSTYLLVYKPVETVAHAIGVKVSAFLSFIKIDFKSTIKSIPFLVLIIIWVLMLCISFGYSTNGIEVYGNRYPTTDLFLGLVLEVLPPFGLLLVIFYSGDLIWKTRSHKFAEIIDSTPIQNVVFFSSKLVVLALIPLVLILVAILIGIAFQLINGYFDFNIPLYLSVFYYGGIQLIFYTIFCLFVQSVVSNKYLGMIISGLVIFLFGPLSKNIGLEHPLLLFNNTPNMIRAYSDFTGYGHYISKFNWIALYWTILSGIFILLSYKYWKRGVEKRINTKITWRFKEKIMIGSLFLLFVTTGGFIFYNINIANEYRTGNEVYDFNEEYERKYKKYDALLVPKFVSVSTKMDIFPSKNSYSVVSENYIENSSSESMNKIFVTAQVPISSLQIENGIQVFHDSILNTYLFELKTPLFPNQQLKMNYQVNKTSTSFSIDNSIGNNGSYIKSSRFTPFLGYVNDYEIRGTNERKKRGLPIHENTIITDSHLGKQTKFNYENVAFETIISTDNNQIAFSSGNLIKHWKQNERSYYQYESEDNIDHLVAYFSGEYQVRQVTHRGVNIELFYLPEHYRNIEEMIRVTKTTIDYCTDNFGAYPYKYLRIGEIPAFAGPNGQAMPGIISINENIFKKNIQNPKSFNVIARVLIHEISHQWWGLLLTPKRIEGALFISESFAKYTETAILEKLYGKEMANQLSGHNLRKYFSGRSRTHIVEPPIYLTAHQQYLAYSKGAIVLNAIRELIGENQLNTALKNLIIKHDKGATATSLYVLEELYQVSSKEKHTLIDDWLKRVITYDLSITTATYKKLENDVFEIKVTISSNRYHTNESGKEVLIDINEPIKIAVFKNHPKDNFNVETLYSKSHQFNKLKNEFTIVVDKLPKYVVIDPAFTRLDRNVSDNIKMVVPE